MSKIKSINSKFIQEGKITLFFKEGTRPITYTSLATTADGPPIEEILAQVSINKACPQSLQLFLEKVNQFFDKLTKARESKNREPAKIENKK